MAMISLPWLYLLILFVPYSTLYIPADETFPQTYESLFPPFALYEFFLDVSLDSCLCFSSHHLTPSLSLNHAQLAP